MNFSYKNPDYLRLVVAVGVCILLLTINTLLEASPHQNLLIIVAYAPVFWILYNHTATGIKGTNDDKDEEEKETESNANTTQSGVEANRKLIALKTEKRAYREHKPQKRLQASILDDRNTIQAGDAVVLVVEDDPFFAKLLLNNIQSKGLKGVVVNQGNLVMSYISRYQPKAILLDINIPKVDGWTVLEEIKANLQFRNIPVHIISGIDDRQKGLNMGAATYLVKPVDPEKLTNVLEKAQQASQDLVHNVAIVSERPNEPSALETTLISNKLQYHVIRLQPDELLPTLMQEMSKIHCIIIDVEDVQTDDCKQMLEAIKSHDTYKDIPRITLTNGSADSIVSFLRRYTPMSQMIEKNPTLRDSLGKTNEFLRYIKS